MIDVIVPVYRGLDETQACLESVWNSSCRHQTQLIVINDCSPEPEVTHWLREQATKRPMVLLENEENLGFVATVNRGMQVSQNDVVLLNSDTEVHGDWLDRLHRAATSEPNVGSVTPFSNNATICSYPAFCQDNELPSGYTLADLDNLFAQLNSHRYFEIPTAVGFCMYIPREVLRTVGLFDVEKFGKGYGEENDFSCRAIAAGYRNILAADTFVWHKGNVSFGDSHNDRKQLALRILEKLHPSYLGNVQTHILNDPAREARLAVDLARWRSSPKRRLLFVTHDRGGGTEQHCRELADLLNEEALVFKLAPEPGGLTCLSAYSRGEAAKFYFRLPSDYSRLTDLLAAIGIQHVHFHHLFGHDSVVFDLPATLGVKHDFTAHDYYPLCPQITLTDTDNRYCGEQGIEQCQQCLIETPAPGYTIETWRERHKKLVLNAARAIAPSASTARSLKNIFPLSNLVVADHPDALGGWEPIVRFQPSKNQPLRVAVLGALSPIKGADLLEAAALDAEKRDLALTFKLFGYAYRSLKTNSRLEVLGAYNQNELPALLMDWKPDLVWFPAQGPETYSYTLSECLRLGLPVLASDLGAFKDRLENRPYSWCFQWSAPAAAWNDKMLEIANNTQGGEELFRPAPTLATFYAEQYLSNTEHHTPCHRPLPTRDSLYETRNQTYSSNQKLRIKLLNGLALLRSHPALSWLARKIPMAIQRRVKNRLLGHSNN